MFRRQFQFKQIKVNIKLFRSSKAYKAFVLVVNVERVYDEKSVLIVVQVSHE